MVCLEPATIVPHTHARATAAGLRSRLLRRFDGDVHRCRTGVAEHVGQGLLNDAIDRQFGGFAGLSEQTRNAGFDGDIRT